MRAILLGDDVKLICDYPLPDLLEGEARIRVRQAGICNTDLELLKGYAGFRGVLGHELVGIVDACPSAPTWEGQRVVGEINAACGACDTCRAGASIHCPSRTTLGIQNRDGAFADFLTLPVENLHTAPDSVTDDQAVFTEPLAAALAVTDLTHIRPSDRVVILGDGKLGLLIAQVLALTGCDLTIIGRHEEKLRLVTNRGIDSHLADRLSREPNIVADVVVEATGTAQGFAAARRMVRPRGKLVLKSTHQDRVHADLTGIVVDEVQVIGSRCGPFAPALRLLEQGLVDVEPLIQARFSLEQGLMALESAAVKGTLKVLIEM